MKKGREQASKSPAKVQKEKTGAAQNKRAPGKQVKLGTDYVENVN